MKTDLNRHANTTMMGVVHDALRRDLARLQIAVSSDPPPAEERRQALAEHTAWMMEFLHHHHHSEDIGLWPLVRGRNPQVAVVLDRMEADHAQVAPAVDLVVLAARRFGAEANEEATIALVAALSGLAGPLLAHLDSEKDEAMPLVSASITDAEWRAWEQKYNVRGKSLSRLAAEAHWLMDGLDPDRYQVLVHLVPAPMRIVIVKGYARRYRIACARRWGPQLDVAPLKKAASSHPQRSNTLYAAPRPPWSD